jgi:Lipopolysaccharide-assembly
MISMIKIRNLPTRLAFKKWRLPLVLYALCLLLTGTQSCKLYSFKDVSIPVDIKTIHISFLENKARYVNPQLSPQLTDKLKQKINNQTRLTQIESPDADYDVSGYVSDYNLSTSGVSGQQAATNRLTVSVHITLKNRLADRKIGTPDFDTDLSRNFDFSSNLSLSEAEAQLTTTIISNMTDEIFNRIFSSW